MIKQIIKPGWISVGIYDTISENIYVDIYMDIYVDICP